MKENLLLLKDLLEHSNFILKYMISVSKIVYIDKLHDIVNEYNNTYYGIIKMKPVAVKCSTYFDFNKENNYEDHKFEVSDHVRISKYKNIFLKAYVPRQSKEVFVIRKSKNHCVVNIFNQ